MNYTDHYDEDGYRACLFSDEMEELEAFEAWLIENDIAFDWDGEVSFDHEGVATTTLDSIMTKWITDKGEAMLLKLTWSGAQSC